MVSHSTNVSGAMAWSGSPAGGSLMSAITRHSHYGWIWLWLAGLARSCTTLMSSLTAPNMRHYDDSFKAAVDGLQLIFDRSLVTSMQPRSVVNQMRDAVADCDDGSSDDGMMLLSMPHDIPEVTFPVFKETRDEETPVVITRRLTPANRPPAHYWRPAVLGPLRQSTYLHVRRYQIFVSPAPVCCRRWTLFRWTDCRDTPSTKSPCGRRLIVTLFWRWRTATVRVARQNIAELMLYVDDHAAHLANCASANDRLIDIDVGGTDPSSGGGDSGGTGRSCESLNC